MVIPNYHLLSFVRLTPTKLQTNLSVDPTQIIATISVKSSQILVEIPTQTSNLRKPQLNQTIFSMNPAITIISIFSTKVTKDMGNLNAEPPTVDSTPHTYISDISE